METKTKTDRMKAEITTVGTCYLHKPDEYGRCWTARNWAIEGGSEPGCDLGAGTLGGWTMAELALIADLAAVIGPARAAERANQYRRITT